MNTLGKDAGWILVMLIAVLWITESFGKGESDEQKWERLAQQKQARRIVEHRYEACMNTCRETCK